MTTTAEPGTDLAVIREGIVITPAERAAAATALAGQGSIHSWLVVMKDVVALAEHICDTQFVPKAIRGNAPAVAAAILAGMELDLPPMTALRHVQVVEGAPSLSAEYKRARVLSAGHKLDITEHTTEACTVTGHRKGHEPVTVRYTIRDARAAGLVKDRGAYVTRPRRMLFARASTEVCDALFTDITNGLPTTELMEDHAEDMSDAELDAAYAKATLRPAPDVASLRRRAAAHTVSSTVVTEDVPPAAPDATPSSGPAAAPPSAEVAAAGGTPQDPAWQRAMKAAQAQCKKVLGDDDEARHGYAARILRVSEVRTFNHLTTEDLRQVASVMNGVGSRDELEAFLTAREVHGE
jgi:hypothetical protein